MFSRYKLARTKKQDTVITVALIAAIGAIIAGYYQGPLADTHWKERPIIDISLGLTDSFPIDVLQEDGDYKYIDILFRNRGIADGSIQITIKGEGAKVNFDKNNNFEYQKSLGYTIIKSENYKTSDPPVYVSPDKDTEGFSIEMLVDPRNPMPPNQEINRFKPMILFFEKEGDIFRVKETR